MKAKHTPGPWKLVETEDENTSSLHDQNGEFGCCISQNAALIAAAPELLEALEAVLQGIAERKASLTQSRNVEQIVVNAIRKAKGE